MIVEMRKGAIQGEIDAVVERAKSLGLDVQLNIGTDKTVVAMLGSNTGQLPTDIFAVLPGVESVTRIMKPYKLASREFKPTDSLVSIDGIGGIGNVQHREFDAAVDDIGGIAVKSDIFGSVIVIYVVSRLERIGRIGNVHDVDAVAIPGRDVGIAAINRYVDGIPAKLQRADLDRRGGICDIDHSQATFVIGDISNISVQADAGRFARRDQVSHLDDVGGTSNVSAHI